MPTAARWGRAVRAAQRLGKDKKTESSPTISAGPVPGSTSQTLR
ncbi:hypothetical protein PV749_36345 [Streptomyces sp. ID03-2B]|nr:hypothetical protein [Streptomyces sp. ID03-2B]MDX3596606.1 hypothetical protein [Streptomyces sp. ID03-2B]